ncbi:diguanylate cyclase [beta proteobacterium AAP121]|nr:diguanylate cyclase [beta proteobacterium AAP65]KPF98262.1 diguanylate cyclase [beta proteobacterium AAP121]
MDLQPREARYAALNLLHQPVWIFDIDLRRVHWSNTAGLHMWSASSLAELCARDMGADMSESVARRLAQYQSDFIGQGATFNEQWTLYPSGKPVSLTVRLSGHRLDDGRMAMLCEAREQAADQPESLRSVEALLHTPVMITLFGEDGRPLYRNPAARASVRRLDEKLAERVVDTRGHAALLAALASDGMATQTLAVHTESGPRWHEISARRCNDAVTGQAALLVSEVDVSAIKRTEAQAQYMALHDALTGLPNRSHLIQRFEMVLGAIRDAQQQAALIFIDLDHFKDVNDTLGHATGDALLIEVSRRLRGAVRGSDLVARLGGDEFLILMVAADIRSEIERVRLRLTRAVAEPVHLAGRDLHVTASIGVALYPQHGTDVQTLMRNADLAMYSAKEGGRNALAFYDAAMADAVEGRTALEAEMRLAFERREFEVHYQPIVEASSGRIVGAEALVRWRHPQRGLVSPDVFIPLCESTGLIRRLGALVFSSAAHQQVAWARAGQVLRISVNLSARQLRSAELLPDLAAALRASGADPRQLQLEITESMLLGQDDELLALFQALQDLQLGLALDDFGTGYSNLAYLQRFPIDTLKIDKTFIQGLQSNRALAELIVSMARLMRLRVVAEGVETQEQLAWVRAQGIEFCQGYLFSRPLPVADFSALLAR